MKLGESHPGGQAASWFFLPGQILLVLTCLVTVIFLQKDFDFSKSKPLHMAVSPELIPHMVLGFDLMASDLYWVRTIQELDYKEAEAQINKGWVFQMLDTVTNLDPRYQMVYLLGSIVVSVIIHDKEGARLLLEKGVKNYPNDWLISYRAAYHYLYEIKDCVRAAQLFQNAAAHGAPAWLNALSSRLYSVSGQYEIAKSVLTDALSKEGLEKAYREQIQKRLDKLEESHRLGTTDDFTKCDDFSNNLPMNKNKDKGK